MKNLSGPIETQQTRMVSPFDLSARLKTPSSKTVPCDAPGEEADVGDEGHGGG